MMILVMLASSLAADRTILLSLDGLGYRILAADPAARELRSLHAIARRGGTFRPLRPAFPSKTSAGHAAIFTGSWAGENGIFSNTNPRVPRSAHRLDESVTGFRSTTLTATPVWTRAAERGRKAVAYQATQAYPFTERSAGISLPRPPVVVNGYQTRLIAPHAVWRQTGVWKDGALELTVERRGDRVAVRHGKASVTVGARSGFSRMLPLEVEGIRTGAYFRLFELDDAGFLLYRTSVHELGVSGFSADAILKATGAFIGNSPTALYRRGGLGKPVYQGGDGTAERRYLECFELVTRQMTRQMLWLDRRVRPDLFVGYYPQVDDLEHVFLGLSRTGHPEVDGTRQRAYAILDRGLKQLLGRFRTVIVVSDHGMAPVTEEIRMGALLAELGWPKERARTNASCVYLNTADWKDGQIPVAEAEAERERLARALGGHRLITRVYRRAELAAYGLTGERQPDACFDVAPLHYPEDSDKLPVVVRHEAAQGEHGFDPNREDMAAILVTNVKAAPVATLAEVLRLIPEVR